MMITKTIVSSVQCVLGKPAESIIEWDIHTTWPRQTDLQAVIDFTKKLKQDGTQQTWLIKDTVLSDPVVLTCVELQYSS